MPNVNDVVSLMMNLRGEIWWLWGVLATFNTALIGWLVEKNASLQRSQRLVATIGYALFCLVLVVGFVNAYGNLAAAAIDLQAAVARNGGNTPTRAQCVDERGQ